MEVEYCIWNIVSRYKKLAAKKVEKINERISHWGWNTETRDRLSKHIPIR